MSSIFLGSLLFSIWMVVLFWGKSIGLSMFLFVVPFSYFIINILEKKNKIKYKESKVLIIPIALLASTYFIFNNEFFRELNILVILVLVLLMCINLISKNIQVNKLVIKILELVFVPLSYIELTLKKLKIAIQIKLKFDKNEKNVSIFQGMLITVPIAIFIIILLASADDVFGSIFTNLFSNISKIFGEFKITSIILKIITIICVFCYLSSFLDYLVNKFELEEDKKSESNVISITTVKMLLITLNIIYIIFCIIQVKSLFMQNGIINYSSYARKGFFQLMIVSFINLIMILISKKNQKSKFITYMCLIMVICTFIILISSAYRMYLYESTFGYTFLRLMVYFVLFTEAILLIPTIYYVLDKKINLVKTYFMIIITMYIIINFSNIENIIATRNVDRYFETGKIDFYYLQNEIGTDGISQIIRIKDINPSTLEDEILKEEVSEYIKNYKEKLEKEKMDFRDFNISKIIAKNQLKEE